MRNPFIFGEVVTGNDFADRKNEITDVFFKEWIRLMTG